ncbi:hypothetical protein BS78_05G245800 [Paspalum vaginatum]|nr:hypothetical protein BS78_05G245800 [Paspalum vaginatum]
MSGVQLQVPATGSDTSADTLPQPHPQQQQQVSVAELSDDGEVERVIRIYKNFRKTSEEEWDEFRGWLLVLATLTASITYSAALNPPGGVWQADDETHGYVAGNPVLYDKFPRRYIVFYYCNLTSFMSSLFIIASLTVKERRMSLIPPLKFLLFLDFYSLGGALLAGSSSSPRFSIYGVTLAALGAIYVLLVIQFHSVGLRISCL